MTEFYEDLHTNPRGWECANHEIHAAPGYVIVIHGWADGKRQRLVIDDKDVDEFCRSLHAAKRYARQRP